MPNKHFCQGPECHTNPTTDRFLKSKGIIRGRYAYAKIDDTSGYYTTESDKYFCSQTCKLQWLNENMESIARRTLPPFIEHRRITEGYEKATEESYGRKFHTIRRISVDNDSQ